MGAVRLVYINGSYYDTNNFMKYMFNLSRDLLFERCYKHFSEMYVMFIKTLLQTESKNVFRPTCVVWHVMRFFIDCKINLLLFKIS